MNNKTIFYNSTNTYYKQDQLTSKRSASEQLSENFGRIVDNLSNKIASDIRGHLLNVYLTAASCYLCALFGIFIRGIFNFNYLAHKFTTFFFVCIIIGFGLCNHKPSLEMKRFYCLLTIFWLFGIKAWSFFEFFVIFISSLIYFILTFFIAPSFIYPLILLTVLITTYLFVIYDTQLITEKRQQRDTDYIWHTAMLFVDFLNIFGYILLILKDKIGNFNNWRNEKAVRYLRGKPQIMTYDMSHLPWDIGVRKSWMTWHTQNLEEFKQQQGITLAQDEVIRRFVRAIFYSYLPLTQGGTELVIKRRGNVVYVAGFLIPDHNPHFEKVYWLYGFTEEILSNLLKQPVKLELQFIRSADDLAVEYFVQKTITP